ncbi:MAG: hypothetical protein JWN34_1819, partial [Bryobacterales bacterium]|nr:hypothetical protein [Bryobacterales bacterium]
ASEATPESVRIEASAARTVKTGKPMTNEDVLALKAAGFGDDFILTKVRTSQAGFVLDTLDLVKLKQAGVSEAVLGAMVQAAER